MNIYCLEDFKVQVEKMLRKRAYQDLEKEIVGYFHGKNPSELASGVRLNHSPEAPYIKKRLGGRGGFRLYFLLLLVKGNLYLMFVHPKTGPMGASNITDDSKSYLYKKVVDCIQSNDLYEVHLDSGKNRVSFSPMAQ